MGEGSNFLGVNSQRIVSEYQKQLLENGPQNTTETKTAIYAGYARNRTRLLRNLDGTSTQWPRHYLLGGKQIFCKPEKGFGFDLEKTVISFKHWWFKHTERFFMDRARLRNLLATPSTHVEVTASFGLVWASCSFTLKFSLVGWLLEWLFCSGIFLSADEFFSVPVEAFVHSRMTNFHGILNAEKLTLWKGKKQQR